MLAVGEHELGIVDDQTLRMTTGLCGGVGNTHTELCGALSAGVMVISGRYGRISPGQDDGLCLRAAAAYRRQFLDRFGSTICQALRDRYNNCPWLVEEASRILLDVLAEEPPSSCKDST